MKQHSAFEYVRMGQSQFFRLPVADLAKQDETAYAGADAVVMGVPHDGNVTYQPGAKLAPFHVRRVSALIEPFHPTHRIDVFGTLKTLDGGNIMFPPFDREAVRNIIQGEVGRVVAAGARPVLVGGDHSLTLPALRAVTARRGPVAVVHIDAHSDTSGPETWGDAFHHGTPFRHALSEGLIDAGHLYQIGLRAPWSTPEDGAFSESHNARIFDMETVMDDGIRAVMKTIRDAIGDRPTYISFDVDACDPSFAPGTGTPVPGGLSSREALAVMRGLAGVDVVGVDVVEVSPPLDHADMTVNLAAFLAYEGLALMALAKKPA